MSVCEDCKNCTIYEDQSEDMRPPFAVCSLGHDIVEVDIMEFTPLKDCKEDFEEGEPYYV